MALMVPTMSSFEPGFTAEMIPVGTGMGMGTERVRMPSCAVGPKRSCNQVLTGLMQGFSLDELFALCFELGIDRDVIGDLAKEPFARTLIEYCERHALLETLVAACEQRRPEIAFRATTPLRELTPNEPSPTPRMTWTTDQLKQVRTSVIDTAKRLAVPDPVGPDLANQLVLGLVMA